MNRIFRYTIFYVLIVLVIIGIFGTFNSGNSKVDELGYYKFFEEPAKSTITSHSASFISKIVSYTL